MCEGVSVCAKHLRVAALIDIALNFIQLTDKQIAFYFDW